MGYLFDYKYRRDIITINQWDISTAIDVLNDNISINSNETVFGHTIIGTEIWYE